MTQNGARLQGFFLTELAHYAARELGEAALEEALRQVAPVAALPLDPTRSCSAESFHALASRLAESAGTPVDAWLRRFGATLFGRLAALHGVFFVGASSAFDFLAGLERGVHDELRRLGAGLAPPRLEAEWVGTDRLRLTYRSDRALAALAHGMLEGCLAHFGESGAVRAEAVPDGAVRFVIERAA